MIIYPALDLRQGKVVRLKEGDPARQTIYGDDPLAVANRWIAAGATWLHVVNLDGALADSSGPNSPARANETILEQLAASGIPIQFGGGLRSLADIRRALEHGAQRVVLGTVAVEQPELLPALVTEWGADRIAVALDARDGQVMTRGWQHTTALSAVTFGQQIAGLGIQHALYTDVSRDGLLTGVNVSATVELGRATRLHVIASGGVSTLNDLRALQTGQVAGAVLGTALYEGLLDLAEAIRIAETG